MYYLKKAVLVAGISDIQNNTQFQIVTNASHGLSTGNVVTISGVENASCNGSFTITKVNDTAFKLDGTTYADPGSFAAASVYVGDRLAIEVTTYSSSSCPVVAQALYQDPATNAYAARDAVRTNLTSAATFVVAYSDVSYTTSIESLNIYNKGGSNLIVKFKYLDYQGTAHDLGTATIATLTRYDEVSGKSIAADGAPTP